MRFWSLFMILGALGLAGCETVFSEETNVTPPPQEQAEKDQEKAERESIEQVRQEEAHANFKQFSESLAELQMKAAPAFGAGAPVTSETRVVKYLDNYETRVTLDLASASLSVETPYRDNVSHYLAEFMASPLSIEEVNIFDDSILAPMETWSVKPPTLQLVTAAAPAPENLDDLKSTVYERTVPSPYTSGRKPYYSSSVALMQPASSLFPEHWAAFWPKNNFFSLQALWALIKVRSGGNPLAISLSTKELGLTMFNYDYVLLMQEKEREEGENPPLVGPERLLNPAVNLQWTYDVMNDLNRQYFSKISSQEVREYALMLAFSYGPDDFFRIFSRNRQHAINIINTMPLDVFLLKMEVSLPPKLVQQFKQFRSMAKIPGRK